jgi:hypothetical protein
MSKFKNLEAMIGRIWQNKHTQEVYKFLSKSQIGDEITIATDQDWLKTTAYDLTGFMNDFKEVIVTGGNEVMIVNNKEKHLPVNTPVKLRSFAGDRVQEISDILFDNIKKVKEDPSYVNQAKSISNTVQTLINLATAELKIKAEQ